MHLLMDFCFSWFLSIWDIWKKYKDNRITWFQLGMKRVRYYLYKLIQIQWKMLDQTI